MKLYWGPHTCAVGIHVLLEEVGAAYVTERLDGGGGETRELPFRAINPKGKVPTLLRKDGSVLTEFSAIATWIVRSFPHADLLPGDAEGEARVVEVVAYVEGTIHGQGYGRLMKPALFEPQDTVRGTLGLGRASVVRQGRMLVETGFAILDAPLGRHAFTAGDHLTIADAALFYVEHWAARYEVALPLHVAATTPGCGSGVGPAGAGALGRGRLGAPP